MRPASDIPSANAVESADKPKLTRYSKQDIPGLIEDLAREGKMKSEIVQQIAEIFRTLPDGEAAKKVNMVIRSEFDPELDRYLIKTLTKRVVLRLEREFQRSFAKKGGSNVISTSIEASTYPHGPVKQTSAKPPKEDKKDQWAQKNLLDLFYRFSWFYLRLSQGKEFDRESSYVRKSYGTPGASMGISNEIDQLHQNDGAAYPWESDPEAE